VSKHAKKPPVLRAGRRIRWTLEVSADVDGQGGHSGKSPSKRSGRSKQDQKAPRDLPPHQQPKLPPAPALPAALMPVTPLTPSRTTTGAPVVPAGRTPAQTRRSSAGRPTGPVMVTLAAIGVLVVGALVFARHQSSQQAAAAAGAHPGYEESAGNDIALPDPVPSAPAPALEAASAAAVPRTVSTVPKKTAAARATRNLAAKSGAPSSSVTSVARVADRRTAATGAVAPPQPVRATPTSASTLVDQAGPTSVTITGCLEMSVDGDQFRLTDTEGADAPRARSWRSGFLAKRSTPVAVEPADPAALRGYVGQRVAVLGLLTDRDLQVRSLRVVNASCD
jgi:hypothetical protein